MPFNPVVQKANEKKLKPKKIVDHEVKSKPIE